MPDKLLSRYTSFVECQNWYLWYDFTGENYTHHKLMSWRECLYEQTYTKTRTHDWSNFPYKTHQILHAKNKYNFLLCSPSPYFLPLYYFAFSYYNCSSVVIEDMSIFPQQQVGLMTAPQACQQLLLRTFKHASTTPPFLFEET